MASIVIDTWQNPDGTTLSITEMSYGPARRYGVREMTPDGRWFPIGGTVRTLEAAYRRCVALADGDDEVIEMRRRGQVEHAYRYQRAA